MAILTTNGFAVSEKNSLAIEFRGPGMNSTRQNPILGATRIRISTDTDRLVLDAELGGVERMKRFLTVFPASMAVGFAIFFGIGMGIWSGQIFGVGFGVPFLQGWHWTLAIVPIAVLPLCPWLILSPMMTRALAAKTSRALDTLLTNIEAAARTD